MFYRRFHHRGVRNTVFISLDKHGINSAPYFVANLAAEIGVLHIRPMNGNFARTHSLVCHQGDGFTALQ